MARQVPVTLPEGYVEFYKNLETWQNEQQIRLKKEYPPLPGGIAELQHKNRPLLQITNTEIDPHLYKELFSKLLAFIKGSRQESGQVMDNIFNRVDELDFDDLAQKIIAEDYDYLTTVAAKMDLPAELLIFTLDHALRPFLRIMAAPFATYLASEEFNYWPFPNQCPCCGSKSRISRLRASDNRRFMFCDRCFTEWETSLLYCVHCGNDEPRSIKYINIENDPAYQIYVCDKCKGYLKTYDERKLGKSTDLFIANIETIYLDLLAREQGYNNQD